MIVSQSNQFISLNLFKPLSKINSGHWPVFNRSSSNEEGTSFMTKYFNTDTALGKTQRGHRFAPETVGVCEHKLVQVALSGAQEPPCPLHCRKHVSSKYL